MNHLRSVRSALVLGVAVAFCGQALAQQPSPAAPAMTTTSKMTAAEKAAERKKLFADKKVTTWPKTPGTTTVVQLTAKECNNLGGKIVYWESCGTTNTKCVVGGHETCIDEHPKKTQ